jgi:lysyl endopeptidase
MCLPAASLAARAAAVPLPVAATDLAQVPEAVVPPVDVAALQAEDAATGREARQPTRFAAAIPTTLSASTAGRWDLLPDGSWRWRLRILSRGALSLNLEFSHFDLPPDGTLRVGNADGTVVRGPFTSADRTPSGRLWTPIVAGDEVVLDLHVGAGERDRVRLELASLNYGYRQVVSALKSLNCETDVVCPAAAEWRDQVRAVGMITINGTGFCTGTMLDDTAHDFKPYFLTAAHCVHDSTRAESVVIYWNFQSPVCGERGGGSLDESTAGAYLRAFQATPAGDFSLLELSHRPDPSYHVFWAGWDARGATPATGTVISHPLGTEKIISFTYHPATAIAYPGSPAGSPLNFWEVTYDDGTTDNGSSGSCLFDENHLCVGDLSDGTAAQCPSGTTDWYARFDASWTGGGSPTTSLQDWLDPGKSGVLSTPGEYQPPPIRLRRRLFSANPG